MANKERNTFVKNQITEAIINLLKEKAISDITISEIIKEAQVSRNSFYRNYADKEVIVREHIRVLLQKWRLHYEYGGYRTNEEMYGSLFAHLKENSEFYLLIKRRKLFHLFLDVFLEIFGPKSEQDNLAAYVVSFITYGTYGWIEEWIARGMKESAESMTALLSSQGKK